MKIWFVHQDAHSPEHHGPTRHFDLGSQLYSLGHETTIITANFSHLTHQYLTQQGETVERNLEGVRMRYLPAFAYQRNNWRRLLAMLIFAFNVLKLKKTKTKPDIIIGSSPSPFTAFAAYRLAKKLKTPFIYEVRDFWPETLLTLGKVSKTHPIVKIMYKIERYLAQHADHILCVLPGGKNYFARFGIGENKITYLPNFADLSHEYTSQAQSNNDFVVMYAGAHGLANALGTLIDTAKQVQEAGQGNIKFRLIGDGLDKKLLQEKARHLELNNISFEAPVPKSQIYQKLSEADAFVILWHDSPLYEWGISANKIFDYMAAAKPIFISSNSPYPLIDKANCGFVLPCDDPDMLAESIIKLANAPVEARAALGANARSYVQAHHDAKKLCEKLDSLCASQIR